MSVAPPERPEGTRCNVMVSAGLASYPCTLGQGHLAHGEPHYAVESRASVNVWENWRRDQIAMDDVNAAHAKSAGFDPELLGKPIQEQVQGYDDGKPRCEHTHTGKRCVMHPGHRTRHVNGTTHWADHESDQDDVHANDLLDASRQREFADCGEACLRAGEHTLGQHCVMAPVEPTKQRPGDQSLPLGGGECVQDLVIWEMQESKRVGMERYGSVLNTFNGRKGIQDVFEEARDLFVYLTQVKREAEADREILVGHVADFLTEWLGGFPADRIEKAEAIVDLIQSWVVAQRQMAPTPPYVFKILHAWREGGADLDFDQNEVPADVQEYVRKVMREGEG